MDYEKLYEEIQSVTNKVTNFVGFSLLLNESADEKTKELLRSLSDAASKISDIAHEVEEHLAWD